MHDIPFSESAESERAAILAWISKKIEQYTEESRFLPPGTLTAKLWIEHIVALWCVNDAIENGAHLKTNEVKEGETL